MNLTYAVAICKEDGALLKSQTVESRFTIANVRAGSGIGISPGPVDGRLSKDLHVRSLRHWFGKARYVFVWKRGAHIGLLQRELADHFVACAK